MYLCVWHRSRFKPAVKYFRNTAHCALSTLRTLECNLINILLVKVFRISSAEVLKLLAASYTESMFTVRVITTPDWNRVTPVAVTAYCPVASPCKPLSKTAFLNMCRLPVDFAVSLKKYIVIISYLNKPASNSAVNQWRTTAPAVRI